MGENTYVAMEKIPHASKPRPVVEDTLALHDQQGALTQGRDETGHGTQAQPEPDTQEKTAPPDTQEKIAPSDMQEKTAPPWQWT